ncbi:MAG: hypothetical protein B7Y36_08385 [Novosphingobium sp. 28-62-57]|uniref:hypothetical protein n=1 Tax=unclassified Novosphingobium TaxID=2644732 RepID=UPI000BC5D703|nr:MULTISPECIES: hypothetical protein [unclassified Novosphingobium]OYW47941.1 MAG: hypothetical protein B7Z36_01475 [Novosphingobium sp. 12-63-9]OYZ10834.1 MAG: hypothetical protein B7Y36_08385 [Novosphingobium sp. 28-62-57]OZA32847.1 MAG: hypothetical protein B7X92_12095 [Novosphingobium sp. 17-62-9]HQS70024.1 hypothetical protein [Novosphingobium sp.]
MRNHFRAHYLSLAKSSENAEPAPPQSGPDWSEDFPLDVPDYDWPDAPDPRVNDLDRHFAWGWMALCAVITLASLTYLIAQTL